MKVQQCASDGKFEMGLLHSETEQGPSTCVESGTM